MAKVPGFGAGGPRFESRYDLVKDHLPVVIVARSLYHHATSHIILRAPFPFPVYGQALPSPDLTSAQ